LNIDRETVRLISNKDLNVNIDLLNVTEKYQCQAENGVVKPDQNFQQDCRNDPTFLEKIVASDET
jgi:hypothetical protein